MVSMPVIWLLWPLCSFQSPELYRMQIIGLQSVQSLALSLRPPPKNFKWHSYCQYTRLIFKIWKCVSNPYVQFTIWTYVYCNFVTKIRFSHIMVLEISNRIFKSELSLFYIGFILMIVVMQNERHILGHSLKAIDESGARPRDAVLEDTSLQLQYAGRYSRWRDERVVNLRDRASLQLLALSGSRLW